MITYCRFCCLDCHGYTGKIADLACYLRKELRSVKYDKFAAVIADAPFGKPFAQYEECYELLAAMVMFGCKKGYRDGGDPPFCQMCCQEKEITGFWECGDAEVCKKLDFLNRSMEMDTKEYPDDPKERHCRVHGREAELAMGDPSVFSLPQPLNTRTCQSSS